MLNLYSLDRCQCSAFVMSILIFQPINQKKRLVICNLLMDEAYMHGKHIV
jgi:hypothetical protein